MAEPEPLPEGRAEVRVVAASPEAARRVAEAIRRSFDATEQRSFPAGTDGGTRLDLTVDTTRAAGRTRSWLRSSTSSTDIDPQADDA
ncbi:hypothetical protein [Streptomyces sp. GSL17-111]|uniref:hypothetical protein n=1 Tax=Streptomyces sp. GSL17-111 TaxID=3121596 RepID=UPI0030F49446